MALFQVWKDILPTYSILIQCISWIKVWRWGFGFIRLLIMLMGNKRDELIQARLWVKCLTSNNILAFINLIHIY